MNKLTPEQIDQICPPIHPFANHIVQAWEELAFMGELDPLPELPVETVAASIAGCSVDVWRASRMLWNECGVRGDIKQAVMHAELVTLAYMQGDPPHPIVEMLATSDPVTLAPHFDTTRECELCLRVFWFLVSTLATTAIIATGLVVDIASRI